MTVHILALAAANALMLVLGTGLLPFMGLARSRAELVTRLPLAYLVGIATTGILSTELGILGIAVGPLLLGVAAAISLLAGLRRANEQRRPPAPIGTSQLLSLLLLGLAGLLLLRALPLFAVKPLLESDGWMIWGLRARALYDFGHVTGPVFTNVTYPGLQHPLWLPSLEAVDFRFMRSFDGTTIHLQLLGIAVAFVGGAWDLLRRHVAPLPLAAALLAIVAAPAFLGQLQTNFADLPLAMFVALGLASLGVWLRDDEPALLVAATLFLGSAAITKNEGELFALTAYISAAAVVRASRRKALAWSALGAVAVDTPWRLWVWAHHLKTTDYSLSSLFSPSYLRHASARVEPSARELFAQTHHVASWSYLPLLALAGVIAGVALRRGRVTLFAVLWLALSFGGLVLIYWISVNPLTNHLYFSSDRTIDSLVIGGALLMPLLLRGDTASLAGPTELELPAEAAPEELPDATG